MTVLLIRGTNADDFLRGTEGADTIYGLLGEDDINGYGGNDTIYGGTGNDFIDGGAGKDTLKGDDGSDNIFSSFDGKNDLVYGGRGSDLINAGFADKVYGEAGNDQIYGGGYIGYGGGGKDIFSTNNNMLSGPNGVILLNGITRVNDFVRGEDKIAISGYEQFGSTIRTTSGAVTFDALDSNNDGKIGTGDAGVSVNSGTIKIDFRQADAAFADGWFDDLGSDGYAWSSGEQSLTVAGITSILRSDFLL